MGDFVKKQFFSYHCAKYDSGDCMCHSRQLACETAPGVSWRLKSKAAPVSRVFENLYEAEKDAIACGVTDLNDIEFVSDEEG
jgi:hypothetical protein